MAEVLRSLSDRAKRLKELIKKLHSGASVREVKKEAEDVLKGLTPLEVIQIEQALVNEGFSEEEIHNLCDIHMELFSEALMKTTLNLPEWHPLTILMKEHSNTISFLASAYEDIKKSDNYESAYSIAGRVVEFLMDSGVHYDREENILFPEIQKRGIVEPPKIMWKEHDQIRDMKKVLYQIYNDMKLDGSKVDEFRISLLALIETLSSHFLKENEVLFPASLKVVPAELWRNLRREFDDIGYCCYDPIPLPEGEDAKSEVVEGGIEGQVVKFPTGELTVEQLRNIFNTLPIDITFIDKDNIVKFFSNPPDRVFIRTKAVLGLKVENCHPSKSVDIVKRVVEDLKTGKKDVAEFWINYNGKFVYIRYFPVRNEKGEFLGIMEVTQDITHIKRLSGEKRLYDFE